SAVSGTGLAGTAVLYVHGYNDYFFQRELADFFADRGAAFYALDLRKYGRSLRAHHTPNWCRQLGDYDAELDAAAEVVLGSGAERLLLVGHSTGGLTLPLWAARRPHLPVGGLILNSPFFTFRQPAAVRLALLPATSVLARRDPLRPLPGGLSGMYGASLHASRHGEWDYDTRWKPIGGLPIRAGWVAAIAEGHRTLAAGLDLAAPALVLTSTRTVATRRWTSELQRGDSVLDADAIARRSPALGRHVTSVRVENAMHDVWLSPLAVRQAAYDVTARWLDAWVSTPGRAHP
ncbi:MAG: alpha/beta hydrolase, partial [Acidimicrobiales bacterium]